MTLGLGSSAYIALADLVLILHAVFIGSVVLGVFVAHSRPVLRGLHIATLSWGIAVQMFPWMCPLTYLEKWLESRGGIQPYQGGFLLHYLTRLIYPESAMRFVPLIGVLACAANLAFYAWQTWCGGFKPSLSSCAEAAE